jgi:methyl-accepting chemotaxis protein
MLFRSKADQKVQILEAELAAISRSQAMVEFSLDGQVLTANENFLRTMGYTADEITGKHHSIFMPVADREGADYKQFWAELRRGEFRSAVFKRVAKGNREIWLQASYNPILDTTGQPIKVIKIAVDVTQARMDSADAAGQVEAIRRSQAVIEFGLDGKILTANENFLRVMGYTLSEIAGQHHGMFVPAIGPGQHSLSGLLGPIGARRNSRPRSSSVSPRADVKSGCKRLTIRSSPPTASHSRW